MFNVGRVGLRAPLRRRSKGWRGRGVLKAIRSCAGTTDNKRYVYSICRVSPGEKEYSHHMSTRRVYVGLSEGGCRPYCARGYGYCLRTLSTPARRALRA